MERYFCNGKKDFCEDPTGCTKCNHKNGDGGFWENDVKNVFAYYFGDYDFDRLHELAEADRDGRCVIVPVKSGQSVYCLQDYFNDTTLKSEKRVKCRTVDFVLAGAKMFETEGFIWRFSEIGEKIFLTREEAEAALATDC